MKLNKTFIHLLIFYCLFSSCSTSNKKNIIVDFFKNSHPVQHIGSDSEVKGAGVYEALWFYQVDKDQNVYIANPGTLSVDKFDKMGNFLMSFGGNRHESVKFRGWIDRLAVDSKGNLMAYSVSKRILLFFSKDGLQFKTINVDQPIEKMSVKRIAFDLSDNLYLLGHSSKAGYGIVRFDKTKAISKLVYTDNKRQRPLFSDIMPDFSFDGENNLYITDTIHYRVYKYSHNGTLLRTFSKDVGKKKFKEKDFNFFIRPGRIEKIPNYETSWLRMKGDSSYYPAIFGINIDGNRIYIWTSVQDKEKKYIVDVYDFDFNHKCTTSYYNSISYNFAFISGKKFFIPNIGSDSMEIKEAVGCFGMFNTPHRIDVFQISNDITN